MVEPKMDSVKTTASVYGEQYFQGGKSKSNYDNYIEQSRGPTIMLAETLHHFFRPASSLDAGCAVGHSVKKLRELGVEAYGVDISEWAVNYAAVPFVKNVDFSLDPIGRSFELVYSYDVVEHVLPERLDTALNALWAATERDLLVVPATYENGETSDPDEPTHLIFQSRNWWRDYIVSLTGAIFNEEATERFAATEHSKIFAYSHRVLVFSRQGTSNITDW